MGRGFESHRGHGIERQVVNNKAIWLFLLCTKIDNRIYIFTKKTRVNYLENHEYQ